MRISTSQLYNSASSQMSSLLQAADKLQTQVSTTKRIQNASDDPAAYARLSMLRQATTDATAYKANVDLATSINDQASSTMSSITTQITRAQELAVQAGSGTLSTADRAAITAELDQILSQLITLANTKDPRGQPLFGGNSGSDAVSQASNGTLTITGTGTPSSIPISTNDSVQPTDSAQKLFGGVPVTAGGTKDVFSIVQALSAAVSSGTGIANAAKDLDAAAAQVTTGASSIGARGTRLSMLTDQMTTFATDREALRSSLEDTDVSTAITELQRVMTVLSATQASFTKLSSLSLFDYLR